MRPGTRIAATAAGIGYLDGARLHRGLRAGIGRLMANRERLNEINVYPVADGDTGTNLAATLSSVLSRLARTPGAHAGSVLMQAADAALDGARGNSGAILAQFFQGLCDSAGERQRLRAQDFVAAVETGAAYAREALSHPSEGTMLTVLRDYGAGLRAQLAAGERDLCVLLSRGLEHARASLARTPELLDVLSSAGVVDAGAQGIVDLLEGIAAYVTHGSVREQPAIPDAADDVPHRTAGVAIDLEYRFCTECLLSGPAVDRRILRERLSALGDSLVIAGTLGKARVHIHTNTPDEVFRVVAEFGDLRSEKADDMRAQQASAHESVSRVAVVMDSAGDMPDALLERLGIHMVPLRVHFGDTHYLDKISITPADVYARLARDAVHPSTSQPTPGDLRRLYDFLTSHHEAVVSIHITATTSGTWQAATSAAARTRGSERVSVVDSRTVSVGQGLLAIYAAECARAGFTAAQVRAAVDTMIGRTRTFGVTRDLEFAVRGGRLPRRIKTIADALRVTPVLMNDARGKVAPRSALWGTRNRMQKFARLIVRRMRSGVAYRIAIGHAEARDEAEALARLLQAALPDVESCLLTEVGAVLGVHTGPGTVVAALQAYTPPERLLTAAVAG